MPWRGCRARSTSISHDVNQPLNAAHSDRPRKHLRLHAAGDPAAADGDRLADRAENGAADRIRPVQRSAARQRGRSGGRQSAVLRNLPGRPAGHGRRDGHRAGSARQRGRCDGRREPDIQTRLRRRASSPAHRRCRIRTPACSRWRSPPCRMENCTRPISWSGALALEHQIGQHHQSARAVCRHARREPALHHSGERLSDGVPGLLRAVPLRRAGRSAIRRRDAAQHRRQQPLQRPANHRREAAGARLAGAGELHLEPLHRYGFERRIPAVLRGRNSFAASRRSSARSRPLRLRRAAQLHGQLCV